MEKTTNLLTYKLNDNETIVVNLVTLTEDEEIETNEKTVTEEDTFVNEVTDEETTTNEETNTVDIVETPSASPNAAVSSLLEKFLQKKNDMLKKG